MRIDYTNGSAQIIDPTGDTVAIYGPGVTRHTLDSYLHHDGWYIAENKWTVTDPPDGRQCPVQQRPPGALMHEHRQAIYDNKSFSNAVTATFHGQPECPACDGGSLRLWQIAMAFDGGGSTDGYDSAPPPAEPGFQYEATLMVCRDRYSDKPGCGFTLPIVGPLTIDLQRQQALAEHAAQQTAARPDQSGSRSEGR